MVLELQIFLTYCAIMTSVFLIICFVTTKIRVHYTCKVIVHFLYCVQGYLNNDYASASNHLIGIFKNTTFLAIDTEKSKRARVLNLCAWLAIYICFGLATYQGILSLFPILAGIVATITSWTGNLKVIKTTSLIFCLLWTIYFVLTQQYATIIPNTIELLACIVGLIRERQAKADQPK